MKLDILHKKLMTAARSNPPSDHVPYAFEKRIMARLTTPVTVDDWALWARALWRAVAPCVAVTLMVGAWSFLSPRTSDAAVNLSQDLENTVLLAGDQPVDGQ